MSTQAALANSGASPRLRFGTEILELTQLGNAERLAAQHGWQIKYCHEWKRWLTWDGKRWSRNDQGDIQRLAAETVRSIHGEAKKESDDNRSVYIHQHARRSESKANLDAMINLAQYQKGIGVSPEHLDRDPWQFNVSNGTLDLKNGTLREHNPSDLLTKLAPVSYDPAATCPVWTAFLNRILGSDQQMIVFLQKAVGYSLTGAVSEKAAFFLYGSGDNGKTTFVEAVRRVMGEYAGTVDIDSLMKKAQTSDKERATADLLGKRFVTSSEATEGEALHEARFKQLTGMGRLTGRRIYGSAFEFDPQFKIFIDANHKPVVRGTDDAIWNRLKLIPFTVAIPKPEQDKQLLEKLSAELPGILTWAVQGCLRWQEEGLGTPGAVTEATAAYRQEMDMIADFIDDCCIREADALETFANLCTAYMEWCKANGLEPITAAALGTDLGKKGFQPTRSNMTRGRRGLRLRGDAALLEPILIAEPVLDSAYLQ